MKVALDTNILAYVEGTNDAARQMRASEILARIGRRNIALPVQVLAELHYVLARKVRIPLGEAGRRVDLWREGYEVLPTLPAAMEDALALSTHHQLQIFDAIILAAAAFGGCAYLLSEDMHEGFQWHGCSILNPFTEDGEALLLALFPA